MSEEILIKALEEIRDKAASWEGRREAPYWNLGDKAAAALKRYMAKVKIGTKGICKSCGEEIEYVGQYWQHTESTPRHPAWPDNKSLEPTQDTQQTAQD